MIDIRGIRKNSQCFDTPAGIIRLMLKKLTNYPVLNPDSPANPHYAAA